MARPAPSVERTVALMTFLARHPGRSFTLSELARQLDINKATTHAMLNALVSSGWILREPDRLDYRLGPALVAIADAATVNEQVALEAAREHMRALASEFDVRCVASAVMGNEIVWLAVEGAWQTLGVVAGPGQRVPLAAPVGAVFVAWGPPGMAERWLSDLDGDPGSERSERYLRDLARIRDRGFALGLKGHSRQRLAQVLTELAKGTTTRRARAVVEDILNEFERDEEEYVVTDIDGAGSYEIGMLSAPVFDREGKVVIALTLAGFEVLTGDEVMFRAQRLVKATQVITAAIHGRPPA